MGKVKRKDLLKYKWLMMDFKNINLKLKKYKNYIDAKAVSFDFNRCTGCTGDTVSNLAARIADAEKEKRDIILKINEIEGAVNAIDDELSKRIIKARYFNGRSWKDICKIYSIKRSTAQSRIEKYIE